MATCNSTVTAAATLDSLPFEGEDKQGFPTYWNVALTGRHEEDVAIGRVYADVLLAWMWESARRNEVDAVCLLGMAT